MQGLAFVVLGGDALGRVPYRKPYLSVSQQIALLESRGMVIADRAKADEYLTRLGYYRLSGYWYPFREVAIIYIGAVILDDRFKSGTDFQTITNLYAFDKRLRLILIDAIERIELAVRTQIALVLGSQDPLAHRDIAKLDGKFTRPDKNGNPPKYPEWIRKLNDKEYSSKEEFAEHYKKSYSTSMPIWIAVELLDFGPLSIFLSGMRYNDARQVSRKFGVENPDLFKSWIRAISVVRNACAHHARIWNRPVTDQPRLPPRGTMSTLDHLIDLPSKNTRIYAVLAIMNFLLRSINPRTEWAQNLKNHISTFPTSSHINLSSSGFPDDWLFQPIWQ